jgi:lysophospholipase L1-like esterase
MVYPTPSKFKHQKIKFDIIQHPTFNIKTYHAMLVFILLLMALMAVTYYFLYQKVSSHLPDSFPNQQNIKQIDHSKKVVVCFGDSNTHGNVSHNWVDEISSKLPDYQVINAGRNSDLTYTLLTRIDDVVACQPDFITILIGTNDVNSTMTLSMEKRYQKLKRINAGTQPNFEGFKANMTQIVSILKTKTSAKIALMSLPIMGENLLHEANLKADQYSDFIQQLADDEQIGYLPVREQQKAYLAENPSNSKHTFEETYQLITMSVIMHSILGWSWDKISTHHGFKLTPDNLHQNSISGGMIRDLVKGFLKAGK